MIVHIISTLDYFGLHYHEGGAERACRCNQKERVTMNIPEDRGYRGPGGYRPREDRLRPLNGMCGEDKASYPECRMSCYIGDEAECNDAKMNKHGQRISCKACKRVTLENCILTYDLDLYFMGTNLFGITVRYSN